MEQENSGKGAVEVLAALNRLSLKAFSCKSRKILIFTLLNETIHVIPYSRVMLWDLSSTSPVFEGVSGGDRLAKPEKKLIQDLIGDLESPNTVQRLGPSAFKKMGDSFLKNQFQEKSYLWLPLLVSGKAKYALWLERERKEKWRQDEVDLLCFLAQGYGVALEKFYRIPFLKKLKTPAYLVIIFMFFASLVGVKVPLRIVAPCEVVPKDPYYVTAPLKGIIDQITVEPGAFVEKGTLLFSYDDKIAFQELNIAEKEVERAASELQRTMSFAFRDPMQLAKMGLLALELEKEKLVLQQAKERFEQLHVEAPVNGVIILDDPEVWRGQPISTGERILMISDPGKTKIRFWIPESDNVDIIREKGIKVFLNIDPASTYWANVVYIGNYARISEAGFNSFIAEGEWVEPPENMKLGLKGTAVLYGENVSLGYFLVRRPWKALRQFIGF